MPRRKRGGGPSRRTRVPTPKPELGEEVVVSESAESAESSGSGGSTGSTATFIRVVTVEDDDDSATQFSAVPLGTFVEAVLEAEERKAPEPLFFIRVTFWPSQAHGKLPRELKYGEVLHQREVLTYLVEQWGTAQWTYLFLRDADETMYKMPETLVCTDNIDLYCARKYDPDRLTKSVMVLGWVAGMEGPFDRYTMVLTRGMKVKHLCAALTTAMTAHASAKHLQARACRVRLSSMMQNRFLSAEDDAFACTPDEAILVAEEVEDGDAGDEFLRTTNLCVATLKISWDGRSEREHQFIGHVFIRTNISCQQLCGLVSSIMQLDDDFDLKKGLALSFTYMGVAINPFSLDGITSHSTLRVLAQDGPGKRYAVLPSFLEARVHRCKGK
jgi:hypothetical protein